MHHISSFLISIFLSLSLLLKIMGESSASYIRMVQHLIEKCLIFNMNKEECMDALSKHANIKPVITATVWKELEKENREFFETYAREREERITELETMQRIQKMLEETAARDADNEG
ncbi:putative angiotensin-converting enzyme 2 [Dioscorea sansibarensis]